jgi:glycosyltransferase involved in cell wall biosynthesis
MRILQVIHQFPPFSSQGSEVYCLQLSKCLLAAGDNVAVFHISNTKPRRPQRLEESSHENIKIFHCIDTEEYSRIADWSNPFLQQQFEYALKQYKPDIVHFHNYISLGDDLVGMAKSSAEAVVYHLHDYGLICPNALLLRDGRNLCEKNAPDFFEGCCPTLIRVGDGRRPFIAANLPSLARWRQFASNQPGKKRRALMQTAVGMSESLLGSPETTAVSEKKKFFLAATQRIFSHVDLFFAPSRFLAEKYIACGVAPEKMVHLRYGMRHFQRIGAPHRQTTRLQFGYIGAFHAHKGVDLLLEAFRGLGDRATLHLHGSSFGSPVSEAHFRQNTAHPMEGVVLHGRYDNSQISTILSGLDAVIVPSRWFENSPLTIQEAQIAGVPVITADVGGMAELVRDGIDGRLFRCNDAVDLRRVLLSLIEIPQQLQVLQAQAPAVPSIENQSAEVRVNYERILVNRVKN